MDKIFYLKGVDAGINVGDIDPLAIDVVMISVGAVDGDALVAVVGALVDALRVVGALVVLEAKGGLVALGHFHAQRIDDVEMGKHLHAVVVPIHQTQKKRYTTTDLLLSGEAPRKNLRANRS